MVDSRDPEVQALAVTTRQLALQVERVLHDLEVHQHKVTDFLEKASSYSDVEPKDD